MCSFPHFSPTCFGILSWNFAHDFLLMYFRSSLSVALCINFWRSYASLWTENIGNVQFSALLSYMLWDIEMKFCIWLWFNVLQIKFKRRYSATVWLSVRPSISCTCLLYALTIELKIFKQFDFGFFNAFFFFRNVLYKNSLLKFSWRAYYAPFTVLRYICSSDVCTILFI